MKPQQIQKKKRKNRFPEVAKPLTFRDALSYAQGLHYEQDYAFLFAKATTLDEVLSQIVFAPEDVARADDFLLHATPLAASQNGGIIFSIPCTVGELQLRVVMMIGVQLQSINPGQNATRTSVEVSAALVSPEGAEHAKAPLLTDDMLEQVKAFYNHDDSETLQ